MTSSELHFVIRSFSIGSHLMCLLTPSLISCRCSSVSLKMSWPSSRFRLNFRPKTMFCSCLSFWICLKNGVSRQSDTSEANGGAMLWGLASGLATGFLFEPGTSCTGLYWPYL